MLSLLLWVKERQYGLIRDRACLAASETGTGARHNLRGNGRTHTFQFTMFEGVLRQFLKHWALWALGNSSAIHAGGISRSLAIRHFAEKQRGLTEDSVTLFEAFHHVPVMFEEALVPTLEHVAKITEPLRRRLRAQTETGRCFPEYDVSALMPAVEFFVRLFGLLRLREEELPAEPLAQYLSTWDPVLLDQLRAGQLRSDSPLRVAVKSTWSRLNAEKPLPTPLNFWGRPWRDRGRIPWTRSFFRVADLEAYVVAAVPTKLPDRSPMRLGDGSVLYPHELLFLGPKRSLVEERNEGLCDLGMYFSVGHVGALDLQLYLGGRSAPNFLTRYGQTDEDRALTLNSHSLRHLQTTELYRLGISELYMTKRFNRRSYAENRRYKHLTLAEDLDTVDIPAGAEKHLGSKAQDTLRLISAGKLRGPLVDEFKRSSRQKTRMQRSRSSRSRQTGSTRHPTATASTASPSIPARSTSSASMAAGT